MLFSISSYEFIFLPKEKHDMAYTTSDIRNIALIGASGSGKTLLTEVLLHSSEAIPTAGTIEAGTTVSDYDDRERSARYSINPTICCTDYGNTHVNIIDAPGNRDFIGRTISVLPAVETAVIVIDAHSGINASTIQLMRLATERNLCRMIVINKIDLENADVSGVLDDVQATFGTECLPINLPNVDRSEVVDCYFQLSENETLFDSVEGAHNRIVDQVVEMDEELIELYLEEEELPIEKLHGAFESALRDGHLIPVCFASALTGSGISELLEIIDKGIPNPLEGNTAPFVQGAEAIPVDLSAGQEGGALAHVFRIEIDPFRGQLGVFRVHRGRLQTGGQLYVGNSKKALKVAHILQLNGKKQTEIDQAVSGDIAALPRIQEVAYNDVLRDSRDESDIRYNGIPIPAPVFGLAVKTNDDADAQKIADALHTVAAEDPSLLVEHVAALQETVLRGMGEMHLREVLDAIKEQSGINIETSFPSIPYRETVTTKAEGYHRHKKQTGGAGQFGEVHLRIEPLQRGEGFEFVNRVVGGVIPAPFIPAVEKGVREVMQSGAISGHEIQDVRVMVYDGKHHAVDSKEVAFVQAGKRAFMNAIAKAKPIVMEPVVNVTVVVPNECMGDVAGDLSSMGGMVKGTNMLPGNAVEIEGQAPLRAVQEYHSRLKSISGGEGNMSIEFCHYARVQPELQAELASSFQPIEE